jgi:hypothetical protein
MESLDKFDVIIRRKNGSVVACIPDLHLYARADNVHAAIDALDAKKRELQTELTEMGEIAALDGAGESMPRRATRPGRIALFAAKALIVIVLSAIAVIYASSFIAANVDRAAERIQTRFTQAVKIGGREFWSKLENSLAQAAEPHNDMPEEKKQKLLADLRTITTRWRPFVVEVGRLFAEPPASPPALPNESQR